MRACASVRRMPWNTAKCGKTQKNVSVLLECTKVQKVQIIKSAQGAESAHKKCKCEKSYILLS